MKVMELMLATLKTQLEQGAFENSDALLQAFNQLSAEQKQLLTLAYQLGQTPHVLKTGACE